MKQDLKASAIIIGISLLLSLTVLGYFLNSAVTTYKQYERSVIVKGLSEKEYKADIVIWPIQFMVAANDLQEIYQKIDHSTHTIQEFLAGRGVNETEITLSPPAITDKNAQQYGNNQALFRYSGNQTVTVYSKDIDKIRTAMKSLSQLGKEGIVFSGENYGLQTEYLFTRLNDVKPEMVEEATNKAREVAQKFATDSQSKLGKIKKASQGRFAISNRDKSNPHIKKIRVVSTVEYYLSD